VSAEDPTRCPGCGKLFKDLHRHLNHPGVPCGKPSSESRSLSAVLAALPPALRLDVEGLPLATADQLRAVLGLTSEGRALLARPAQARLESRSYRTYTRYTGSVWFDNNLGRVWAEVPAQLL
jgi:hypothetical protein